MTQFYLYFDALCEPTNPGGLMSCAWILKYHRGDTLVDIRDARTFAKSPRNTNNAAEWLALGLGLAHCLEKKDEIDYLTILGDSQLVIYQLTGRWTCQSPKLQKYRTRCKELLTEIVGEAWTAQWIPREKNTEADMLSRLAYKEKTGKMPPERRKRDTTAKMKATRHRKWARR